MPLPSRCPDGCDSATVNRVKALVAPPTRAAWSRSISLAPGAMPEFDGTVVVAAPLPAAPSCVTKYCLEVDPRPPTEACAREGDDNDNYDNNLNSSLECARPLPTRTRSHCRVASVVVSRQRHDPTVDTHDAWRRPYFAAATPSYYNCRAAG